MSIPLPASNVIPTVATELQITSSGARRKLQGNILSASQQAQLANAVAAHTGVPPEDVTLQLVQAGARRRLLSSLLVYGVTVLLPRANVYTAVAVSGALASFNATLSGDLHATAYGNISVGALFNISVAFPGTDLVASTASLAQAAANGTLTNVLANAGIPGNLTQSQVGNIFSPPLPSAPTSGSSPPPPESPMLLPPGPLLPPSSSPGHWLWVKPLTPFIVEVAGACIGFCLLLCGIACCVRSNNKKRKAANDQAPVFIPAALAFGI